jgi:hypothetical protein
VKKLEQRTGDRKLAMWTQGKWGGVMFVPGGLLVQGDKFRMVEDDASLPESPAGASKEAKAFRRAERQERREAKLKKRAITVVAGSTCDVAKEAKDSLHGNAEDKQKSDSHTGSAKSAVTKNTHNTHEKQRKARTQEKKHRRQPNAATGLMNYIDNGEVVIDNIQLPTPPSECLETRAPTPVIQSSSRNSRHIIRGRNIQAKRMAFADTKMLDEVRHCEPFLGKDC